MKQRPARSVGMARVAEILEDTGLLLLSDNTLPSVATIVAGGPIRGSWWGHPKGGEIYRAAAGLEQAGDVVATRLVSGKVTFVHRRLWQALLSVARSAEPWQTRGLSLEAKSLWTLVRRAGTLRIDTLSVSDARRIAKPREAAKELEAKLLLHAEDVHTEKGAHAKRLETWESWASRVAFEVRALSVASAKRRIEASVRRFAGGSPAMPRLPWVRTDARS